MTECPVCGGDLQWVFAGFDSMGDLHVLACMECLWTEEDRNE